MIVSWCHHCVCVIMCCHCLCYHCVLVSSLCLGVTSVSVLVYMSVFHCVAVNLEPVAVFKCSLVFVVFVLQ